jgi:hypothetical protein
MNWIRRDMSRKWKTWLYQENVQHKREGFNNTKMRGSFAAWNALNKKRKVKEMKDWLYQEN